MFTRLDVTASQIVITRPLVLEGPEVSSHFDSAHSSLDKINDSLSEILTAGFSSFVYPGCVQLVLFRNDFVNNIYRSWRD